MGMVENIVELRKMMKISQGKLADMAGIPRTYLSRIENGHVSPTADTLDKLFAVLGDDVLRTTQGEKFKKANVSQESMELILTDREGREIAAMWPRLSRKQKHLVADMVNQMAPALPEKKRAKGGPAV